MRTFPDRPIVSVGAVILDAGRVVLVKRGHPPLEGRWSLPGGVVELGETLETAITREVFEETGLVVEVGPVVEVLDRLERSADGRIEYHYVIIDYLCRPGGEQLAGGSDAAAVEWVPLAHVRDYQVTDNVQEVIEKAVVLSNANKNATTEETEETEETKNTQM